MNSAMIVATQNFRPVGRPKKPNSVKHTFRFETVNLEMLKIYAERNCLDMTAALNMLLRQNLSAIGLMDEAKKRLEEERRQEGGNDD